MSGMKETDFPPLEPQPFVTEEGREIQRLRAELAAERETTVSLLRIIALIREAGGFRRDGLAALPDAVKAMRQQRDEAQQDICYDEFVRRYETGHEMNTPEGIAAERGWDCFAKKEGGGA